jgi:hypothetical protein
MNWVSFFMGIITVLLTYAFLSSVMEEETEDNYNRSGSKGGGK